jgi:hypothetical protein
VAQREPLGTGTHVAFTSPDRATVAAFDAAALDAGGTDNGAPGPREHYNATYYCAFVLDPEGSPFVNLPDASARTAYALQDRSPA